MQKIKAVVIVFLAVLILSCNGIVRKPHRCSDPESVAGRLVQVDYPLQDRYIIKLRTDRHLTGVMLGVRRAEVLERGLAVRMTEKTAKKMLELYPNEIEYIEPEQLYTIVKCTYGKDQINQRNLKSLDGNCAYSKTGAGVHVFVLDTGIDPDHEGLGG